MKIVAIRILGRSLPMTLVELHTDEGLIGIGGTEAPSAIVRPILQQGPWRLEAVLIGRDPLAAATVAQDLFRATLGQGGPIANAMAALDMALWDLAGKAQGVPLHQLFGERHHPHVPVYASATAYDVSGGLAPPLQFKPTERLVAEAKARVREGFTAIKFGWGNRFAAADLQRIAAIRDAIGPDVRLMLDIGAPDYLDGDVSPRRIAKLSEQLAEFNLFFLEEPLAPYAVEGYAELCKTSKVPIATGEMLCHAYEFDQFLDARAVNVIQPDAYRIGLTTALRVARRAAAAQIMCIPHSPWSALAIAAHANVLATSSGGVMLECPSPSLYSDTVRHGAAVRINTTELVTHPLLPASGKIEVPSAPGLGVGQFNYDAVAALDQLAEEGLER